MNKVLKTIVITVIFLKMCHQNHFYSATITSKFQILHQNNNYAVQSVYYSEI